MTGAVISRGAATRSIRDELLLAILRLGAFLSEQDFGG